MRRRADWPTSSASFWISGRNLESRQNESNDLIAQLTQQQKTIAQQIQAMGEELTALRVYLGQVQEKHLSSQQTVARPDAAAAELAQQIERLDRSASTVRARCADVQRERDGRRNEGRGRWVKRFRRTRSIPRELAEQIARLGQVVAELSSRVEATRGRQQGGRAQLHDLELRAGELRIRIETLVHRTREELQLDLPARYAQFDFERKGL